MFNILNHKISVSVLVTFLFFLILKSNINAQGGSGKDISATNIIKLNVAGLIIGNISLQDEFILNKKLSLALGYNVVLSSLFFPKYILPSDQVNFKDMDISGYSITPEFRIYLGKSAPTGYYLAPYFRYSDFSVNSLDMYYDSQASDTSAIIPMTTTLSGTYVQSAFGLLFGKQWKWGSHFSMDWWIMGIAFGKATINMNAAGVFTDQDVADIENSFAEMSVPGTLEYTVTNSLITVNYKQGFPSGRMGFAIGYIF